MDSTYKERVKYFEHELSPYEVNEGSNDLEWKPVIDIKTFREKCLHGIPDEAGLRATGWKVLLGYLPPDKRMWPSVLLSQRLSYYNWVRDFVEDPGEEPPSSDHPLNMAAGSKWATYFHDNNILEQIDKDVRRTLPDIAFFQTTVPRNPLNPLSAPLKEDEPAQPPTSDPLVAPEEPDKPGRRFSFGLIGRPRSSSSTSKKSLKNAITNNRSRSNSKSSVHSTHSNVGIDLPVASPRNIVRKFSSAFKSNPSLPLTASPRKKIVDIRNTKPICPPVTNRRALFARIGHLHQEMGIQDTSAARRRVADKYVQDLHWEVIERILFIYAKLNPGVGYVQGMNELLAPIYYVFAKDSHPDIQAYAEADAFFVFTILMSNVRDHFVRSMDLDASTGIHATMQRMSQRLAWIDRPLWRDLKRKDIKEQYYAFRWITVLCSQEWDLPDVIRLWDSMLADRAAQEENGGEPQFEFLLDFCVAMLLCIRQELLRGDFAENVRLLQNYPLDDIQVVLNTAYTIREVRLNALSAGQIVPGVNDKRDSATFGSDWSDTSSINSTSSGNRLRLLRDTTGMARASFESFRRESRESLDDMFKKGLAITHRGAGAADAWKRASTGEVGRSISQRFSAVNSLASRVKRAAAVGSPGPEAHRDAGAVQRNGSVSSTRSEHSTMGTPSRTNSIVNRFSHMMANNAAVTPYLRSKGNDSSNRDAGTPPSTRTASIASKERDKPGFVESAEDHYRPSTPVFSRGYV